MSLSLTPQEATLIAALLEGHARKLTRARDNRIARGKTYVPPKGKRDAALINIARAQELAIKVRASAPSADDTVTLTGVRLCDPPHDGPCGDA